MRWRRRFLRIGPVVAMLCAGCGKTAGLGAGAPAEIRLMAGDGESRLHHTRTGPTWTDPDVAVGDTIFQLGEHAAAGRDGLISGMARDEVAAFVAGSVVRVEISLAAGSVEPVTIEATGFFEHAPDSIVALGGTVVPAQEREATLEVARLPAEVGILVLDLAYRSGSGRTLHTRHRLPLTWGRPVAGVPIYEQTVLWAGRWVAGQPARAAVSEAEVGAVEDEIAARLLRGVWTLGEQGYSYGPVKRPKNRDNEVHVLLDFKQASCGEYRALLLSLLELHGIDAHWLMMAFQKPSRQALSMYETRSLPAVGTGPKVWRHWNHAVVELNGRIYDPTYGLQADSFPEYEDSLFARYCLGEDSRCRTGGWCNKPRAEGLCVDNPPGFDPDDPANSLRVWRGDDY